MVDFQNIKQVCTLFSKLNAKSVAEQSGQDLPKSLDTEINQIAGKEKIIEEISKKRGILGVHGPTRSGLPDTDGKWIEFVALTQTFNIDALELKNVINEISRSFKISMVTSDTIKVSRSYSNESHNFTLLLPIILSPQKCFMLWIYHQ